MIVTHWMDQPAVATVKLVKLVSSPRVKDTMVISISQPSHQPASSLRNNYDRGGNAAGSSKDDSPPWRLLQA